MTGNGDSRKIAENLLVRLYEQKKPTGEQERKYMHGCLLGNLFQALFKKLFGGKTPVKGGKI
jgi:hypothetical protein